MTNIIIAAGNKGSFFSKFCEILKEKNIDNLIIIEFMDIKGAYLEIDNLETLKNIKNNHAISLIYMGGETRNEDLMYAANCELPIYLITKIGINLKKFIYLSSLAALPHQLNGIITPESKGKILVDSIYAKTKNRFDSVLKRNINSDTVVSIIYPASIINPIRQTSSLQKIIHVFKKYKILKYFKFDGYISFCARSEVYDAVYSALQSSEQLIVVVANNICISSIQRYIYGISWQIPIPNMVWLLYILKKVLPLKIYILSFNIFSRAVYGSSNNDIKIISNFDLRAYID